MSFECGAEKCWPKTYPKLSRSPLPEKKQQEVRPAILVSGVVFRFLSRASVKPNLTGLTIVDIASVALFIRAHNVHHDCEYRNKRRGWLRLEQQLDFY